MLLRETNQETDASVMFMSVEVEEETPFEDFVQIIRINEGSKSEFYLPLTKNATNWE